MKFEQPFGQQLFGFTVGNRAKVGFTKTIGTILGIKNEGGEIRVTVGFEIPQPVDAPAGATADRFELGWRAIQATWSESATVTFENVPLGSYFKVPEDNDDVIYLKTTRGGTPFDMTTVLNHKGVDLGCEGFADVTCLPVPAPAIQLGETLSDILEVAKADFWKAVANRFPQCTSGDFPPGQQLALNKSCEQAVRVWLDCNLPHGTQIRTEDGFLLTFGDEGYTDGDVVIKGLAELETDFAVVNKQFDAGSQPPQQPPSGG